MSEMHHKPSSVFCISSVFGDHVTTNTGHVLKHGRLLGRAQEAILGFRVTLRPQSAESVVSDKVSSHCFHPDS